MMEELLAENQKLKVAGSGAPSSDDIAEQLRKLQQENATLRCEAGGMSVGI